MHLTATVHIGHVAAAIHTAVHSAATHAHRGQTNEFGIGVAANRIVIEADTGQVAASINITFHSGTKHDDDMGLVVGGGRKTDIVMLRIVEI